MVVLGFDTATPATAVAVLADGREPVELRHDPAPGERPGHAQQLLALARRALGALDLGFADVDRIGVGVGPGTFTGLRIGVATARALAQGGRAELVAVSSLQALAEPAQAHAEGGAVLAVLDARRGEAFAASFRAGQRLRGPEALVPERLPELLVGDRGPWLAVGDGALRFAEHLDPALVSIAPADSSLHRVSALAVCRLARVAAPVDREALVPDYVRAPDARPRPGAAPW